MILETLNKDLIQSLKAKDTLKVLVIRYLSSEIKNYAIELRGEGKELTDSDALLVIKRQIKKRTKAIEQYKQGNREDIVQRESEELTVVQEYFDKFSQDVVLPN